MTELCAVLYIWDASVLLEVWTRLCLCLSYCLWFSYTECGSLLVQAIHRLNGRVCNDQGFANLFPQKPLVPAKIKPLL